MALQQLNENLVEGNGLPTDSAVAQDPKEEATRADNPKRRQNARFQIGSKRNDALPPIRGQVLKFVERLRQGGGEAAKFGDPPGSDAPAPTEAATIDLVCSRETRRVNIVTNVGQINPV